ncbi:MAG: prepilin peptidase [Proteobacteria bacterium]|nr:prepilin peptidase [Pseudomonadota bacterium]
MSVVEAIFGGTLALACIIAMVSDARSRVIPNLLSGLLLLVGLGFGFHEAGITGLGWHAAHAALALLIGMALFAVRWVGGGDGKFYAACAAWFPIKQGAALGAMIALCGLALVLVWLIWRRLSGKTTFSMRPDKSAQLPFGIAIGLGTIATYALRF